MSERLSSAWSGAPQARIQREERTRTVVQAVAAACSVTRQASPLPLLHSAVGDPSGQVRGRRPERPSAFPPKIRNQPEPQPRASVRRETHTHRLRGTAGHGRFHTPVFAAEACAHTHGTHAAPAGAWAPARRPVCHHEATPEPPPPPRLAAGPGSAIPAFLSRPFQAAEAFTTLPACLPSGARTLCLGSSPAFQKDREHARLCTGPAELGASSSPSFLKGQLGSPLEQGAGGLDRGQPASLLPPPAPWLLVPQHGGSPRK